MRPPIEGTSFTTQARISGVTRRNLINAILRLGNLEGQLELLEFLDRIWPLVRMPSTDSRFDNAYQDIWQHMVNNHDWD